MSSGDTFTEKVVKDVEVKTSKDFSDDSLTCSPKSLIRYVQWTRKRTVSSPEKDLSIQWTISVSSRLLGSPSTNLGSQVTRVRRCVGRTTTRLVRPNS